MSPGCTVEYNYVYVHKELVPLPFTISSESQQIVSIHWTGIEGGTGDTGEFDLESE